MLSAVLAHTKTAQDSKVNEEKIQSAMSAGPASISANATVRDWDMSVLRKGTNEWTCLPDRPDTPGNDPWCMNEPWLNFLSAYMKKEKPTYTQIGFAYMLMGDSPVSNTDPYATAPTATNEWVEHMGPHIMMLVPDKELLRTMTKDHKNGGPFVMWAGTPYEHVMIPLEEEHQE